MTSVSTCELIEALCYVSLTRFIYWSDKKHVRYFLTWLSQKLGITNKLQWNHRLSEDIVRKSGGGSILASVGGVHGLMEVAKTIPLSDKIANLPMEPSSSSTWALPTQASPVLTPSVPTPLGTATGGGTAERVEGSIVDNQDSEVDIGERAGNGNSKAQRYLYSILLY